MHQLLKQTNNKSQAHRPVEQSGGNKHYNSCLGRLNAPSRFQGSTIQQNTYSTFYLIGENEEFHNVFRLFQLQSVRVEVGQERREHGSPDVLD